MKACFLCGRNECKELVDFGEQPICHHFFDGTQPEDKYPLVLGQCESCGLLQLMAAIAPEKLVPRFDWITYSEPEAHLDALVDVLSTLPGIGPEASIWGVTYKEDTTLRRFGERGFKHGRRLDPGRDLKIHDSRLGIETCQSRIRPALAIQLREKYGAPDLVIVRHILEHTQDMPGFLRMFREWIKPTGYVVFEVPDCERAFHMLDYTTLWEDHTLYFVERTFLMCLRHGGFSVVHSECYRAPYNNCLVAIVKPSKKEESVSLGSREMLEEKEWMRAFAEGFAGRRRALRDSLAPWRRQGKVAVFGAGHQSVMFINLMGVADLIDFVIDDHPRKCGLRMPGSRLPIVRSDALVKENVKLCLTSLGAESEKIVIGKHRRFVEEGGAFASIFPVRRQSLLNFLAGPNQPCLRTDNVSGSAVNWPDL